MPGIERTKLYDTQRWRRERKIYLARQPFCVMCLKHGMKVFGTIVDHIVPHRGDVELFFDVNNRQTLCAKHHSGAKQRHEKSIPGFDINGFPIDPNHPWNKEPIEKNIDAFSQQKQTGEGGENPSPF
jgi:5-methylcytosine-specific restriction protein A